MTGHKIDFDGIKILDRADYDPKIKVKEIDKKKTHIDKKKTSVKTQINLQTEFRYIVNIVGSKKKKLKFLTAMELLYINCKSHDEDFFFIILIRVLF